MQVRLHGSRAGVFGGHRPPGDPGGPLHCYYFILFLERERTEGKKRDKFYIYSDVTHTHTHPAGAGSTLKGKRKKKANTDDGQKAETAREGEGNRRTSKTNLHGETDLTKTVHTPQPYHTLRRGTRGELGTKLGD